MMWTDNPVLDAERDYNRKSAAERMWEKENYVGKCPLCGKPMFTNAYDCFENAVEDEDGEYEYIHEFCQDVRRWDREEAKESFDEMMGNPMDALDRLVI